MTLINKIKENALLYFAFKLIRFLTILFILDFSIGHGVEYFYFKQQIGRHYRSFYSIEKTNAEILIFGPSTANNNYVPDIFESRLKQTCHNTASPGQFILYHYATLKAILDRYTPKIIFLDIVPGEFRIESDTYERLSFLLPYYKRDTALQSVVDLKGPFEKYKLISSIYAFNSTPVVLAAGQTDFYISRHIHEKGYQALTRVWEKPLIETDPTEPYPLDTIKINVFKSFIKDCHKAGIKLVVVCSPRFINAGSRDFSILAAEGIAKNQNVLFMDFTNDPFFLNRPHLFDEPLHLNKSGSQEFTNILIDKTSGNR